MVSSRRMCPGPCGDCIAAPQAHSPGPLSRSYRPSRHCRCPGVFRYTPRAQFDLDVRVRCQLDRRHPAESWQVSECGPRERDEVVSRDFLRCGERGVGDLHSCKRSATRGHRPSEQGGVIRAPRTRRPRRQTRLRVVAANEAKRDKTLPCRFMSIFNAPDGYCLGGCKRRSVADRRRWGFISHRLSPKTEGEGNTSLRDRYVSFNRA